MKLNSTAKDEKAIYVDSIQDFVRAFTNPLDERTIERFSRRFGVGRDAIVRALGARSARRNAKATRAQRVAEARALARECDAATAHIPMPREDRISEAARIVAELGLE